MQLLIYKWTNFIDQFSVDSLSVTEFPDPVLNQSQLLFLLLPRLLCSYKCNGNAERLKVVSTHNKRSTIIISVN